MSLYIALTRADLKETTKTYDTTIAVDYNGNMYKAEADIIVEVGRDDKKRVTDVDIKFIHNDIRGIEKEIISKITKGELIL